MYLPNERSFQHVCISTGAVVEQGKVLQKILESSCGGLSNDLDTHAARRVDVGHVDTKHLLLRNGLLRVG